MNPACELCKGACCEGFGIRLDESAMHKDDRLWWQIHGQQWPDGITFIPSPCTRLKDGKCVCYDARPSVCCEMKVGGSDCRNSVRQLRQKNWSSIFKKMENT